VLVFAGRRARPGLRGGGIADGTETLADAVLSIAATGHLLHAVAFLLLATTAHAQLVERVIDGDTVVVQSVGKVRLIGVDTPELGDPRAAVDAMARRASAFVEQVAAGKQVRLDYDWQRHDKYGRTLAYAYLPDGSMLNAEIIRQGYGYAYTKYPFKYRNEFRGIERKAREAHRGLWASDAPGAVPVTTAAHSVALAGGQQSAEASETVYVTRTGQAYHRAGCRSLSKSQIPMTLEEAAARYRPCSICRPPVLGGAAAGVVAGPVSHLATTGPPQATVPATAAPKPCTVCANPTVWIAGSGVYHIDQHCAQLRATTPYPAARWLSELSAGYTPCQLCGAPPRSQAQHPPFEPAHASTATSTPQRLASPLPVPLAARPSAQPVSGRCQAITKKGTQCSRRAKPGSQYCWQHGG
jgi:micrococcal nuclease